MPDAEHAASHIPPCGPYIADAEIDNFAPWPLIKWVEMMTGSAVPATSDEVIDGKTYSVR